MESWAPPPLLHVAGEIGHLRELGSTPAVADRRHAKGHRLRARGRTAARKRTRERRAPACRPPHRGHRLRGPRRCGPRRRHADRRHARPRGNPISRFHAHASRSILEHGCAISEVPTNARVRRWNYIARNRIVAGLACALVVVEAEATPSDLALRVSRMQLGRRVLAVPGRVTSPASHGTHELIAAGAPMVRDARDVLDGLYGARTQSAEGSEQTALLVAPRAVAPQPSALTGARSEACSGGRGHGRAPIVTRASYPRWHSRRSRSSSSPGALSRGDGGRYIAVRAAHTAPRARL